MEAVYWLRPIEFNVIVDNVLVTWSLVTLRPWYSWKTWIWSSSKNPKKIHLYFETLLLKWIYRDICCKKTYSATLWLATPSAIDQDDSKTLRILRCCRLLSVWCRLLQQRVNSEMGVCECVYKGKCGWKETVMMGLFSADSRPAARRVKSKERHKIGSCFHSPTEDSWCHRVNIYAPEQKNGSVSLADSGAAGASWIEWKTLWWVRMTPGW